MRRYFILALLGIWIATTGSSCQSTASGGSFRAQGEGAGVILVVLVAAGVSCLANDFKCGSPEPGPFHEVYETFETGVAQVEAGDPAGLDLICLAAHQGYAKAQYYYGVHLFRQNPTNAGESLAWLERAAAQDHKAARYMLAQMSDWRPAAQDAPASRPLAVSPPALRACVERPGPRPAILEARGEPQGLQG